MGWVISQANEWEGHSKYFGEGVEISKNWATTHFLVFDGGPWNYHGNNPGCHLACWCVTMSIYWWANQLICCRPLLLLSSIFPSIRVFSNELALRIRRPKYWNFSSIPSNEHSGLLSFRIDWLDLLEVQETLKSLLYIIEGTCLSISCRRGLSIRGSVS